MSVRHRDGFNVSGFVGLGLVLLVFIVVITVFLA